MKTSIIKSFFFDEVGKVELLINRSNFTFIVIHTLYSGGEKQYTRTFSSYSAACQEFRFFASSLL